MSAGQAAGPLCLHHLRRHASRLTWEAVRSAAARLLEVADGRSDDLPVAMWASPELADVLDDDDGCPVCAVRMAARSRLFEWIADAVHRFPAQAAGSAVALCATHGWAFQAWSREPGDVVLSQAAELWTRRLSWLVARLDRRPADRLGVRLAALPNTLSDLMDDEGRLALAEIARATAAAVLRTPTAVLAHLTATALRTEGCPVCVAEDHAGLQAAASCQVAVCASHLRVVHRAQPDRTTRRVVARATADRLRREAASLRGGAAS